MARVKSSDALDVSMLLPKRGGHTGPARASAEGDTQGCRQSRCVGTPRVRGARPACKGSVALPGQEHAAPREGPWLSAISPPSSWARTLSRGLNDLCQAHGEHLSECFATANPP